MCVYEWIHKFMIETSTTIVITKGNTYIEQTFEKKVVPSLYFMIARELYDLSKKNSV